VSRNVLVDGRLRKGALCAFVLGALLLGYTASASADVYWTDTSAGTIGRAELSGANVNQNFITGASEPDGVVTYGNYIFWTNYSGGTIGRANRDGTGVNQNFITGLNEPEELTASTGHLYWAEFGANNIGRATVGGAEVEPEFIKEAGQSGEVRSLTINGAHIYWTTQGGTYVSRAKLDGSDVEGSFYHEPGAELWAVASTGNELYWSNCEEEFTPEVEINRANLNAEEITFGLVSGASCARGLFATESHLYWANGANIVRSTLTGEDVEEFIEGGGFPLAVTVSETVGLEAESSSRASTGESIHDSATVTGGSDAQGMLTFTLYGPSDEGCGGTPVYTSEIAVAGDGSYPSASYTPTEAGTYRWRVSFSGDSQNEPAELGCGAEHQSAEVVTPPAPATAEPTPAAPAPTSPASTPFEAPSPTQCASSRVERIHWRVPRGAKLKRIAVTVDGKTRTLPGATRHTAVSLVGDGDGAVSVVIKGWTTTGTRYTDTRIYHPCAPGTVYETNADAYLRRQRPPST
jgi:virginiamycin B lyase